MANKLWSKGTDATKKVEQFTIGNDNILDMRLAKYDVAGSKAHIAMLREIGLIAIEEESILQKELDIIASEIEAGHFFIEDGVEDIHSQVELLLTRRCGEIGKKIHSGRSRNDQVLVDLKLYFKDEVSELKHSVKSLFDLLIELSEKYKDIILPGYTHGQIAMPSSFGLWFGGYAETLIDDMRIILAAYDIADQNPLGSSAGFGNSFPLDREKTTELLHFSELHYNSIAAQMSRGKCEKAIANAIAAVATTIDKLSQDCWQYMCSNFKFISFPDELTTGSSIMPHKKNPDVWELLRAKCNRLQALPNEITLLCTNLPHGYHRDYQLLKEIMFPAFDMIAEVIDMTIYALENINVNEHILDSNDQYNYMFTVEEVNNRVLNGTSFRDAYKSVGIEVNNQTFVSGLSDKFNSVEKLHHSHIGSIGNLANDRIVKKMEKLLK